MAPTGFDIGSALDFQGASADTTYPSTNVLFQNIIPNLYLIAGLVVFFMILFGGFSIIANRGSKDKVTDGKKVISSAIIGLLVLFASYWIIQIIQVVTDIQILNPKI